MAYKLMAHPRLSRDLERTPARIATELRKALDALAKQPEGRHDLKRIQAVSTMPPTLRLRVGTYRILLKIDHARKEIIVLRLGPRASVYKGLEHLDRPIDVHTLMHAPTIVHASLRRCLARGK